MGRPATILFLGANPSDETRLALGREVRKIDQRLLASKHREAFRIEQAWAVRATDLQACLQRYQPAIVHFSGHGDPSGELLLEDRDGRAKPVTTDALADLFRILGKTIRCVVLNACYSEAQARAIAEHIDVVIGMKDAVDDDTAIAFAEAFYQALGYGQDAQTAFELGRSQIRLAGRPDAEMPALLTRPEVDARAVMLAEEGTPACP
jgi:hypothetical protein